VVGKSQPAKEKAKATGIIGMVNKQKTWAFLSEVALLRDAEESIAVYGITIGFNTRNEEQTGLYFSNVDIV